MNDHFFFFFLRNMNDNFLCGQKNTDVLGLFFNWLKKNTNLRLCGSLRLHQNPSPLLEHPSTREYNLTEMGRGHKYWTMKTDEQ